MPWSMSHSQSFYFVRVFNRHQVWPSQGQLMSLCASVCLSFCVSPQGDPGWPQDDPRVTQEYPKVAQYDPRVTPWWQGMTPGWTRRIPGWLIDWLTYIKTCDMTQPTGHHFNLPGHSLADLKVLVIEKKEWHSV